MRVVLRRDDAARRRGSLAGRLRHNTARPDRRGGHRAFAAASMPALAHRRRARARDCRRRGDGRRHDTRQQKCQHADHDAFHLSAEFQYYCLSTGGARTTAIRIAAFREPNLRLCEFFGACGGNPETPGTVRDRCCAESAMNSGNPPCELTAPAEPRITRHLGRVG